MLSLVWFQRDLRVQDHPGLVWAAGQGAVLPVYVVEPDLWAQPEAAARHHAFLEECLTGLRADLARAGQPLVLRAGDAVEVLSRLHGKHGFSQLVTLDAPSTAWSRARDRRVADWARSRGLAWAVLPQPIHGAPLPAPALPPVTEGTGALPGLRALGLTEDRCPFRQPGGRAAGEQTLEAFLSARAQGYARGRATLTGAERTGSRLSAYLAWGVLSVREVLDAARARRTEDNAQGLRAFAAQLARRTVAALPDPGVPADVDPARLAAWQGGETGLPFVDAAMRALAATGWLNARTRGLVASVGCHHLGLDWRVVGARLARLSTDFDPALHGAAMRAVAGTDTAPRVPDPVAVGRQQALDGAFIRRWVPELAPVPEAHLHTPWCWPGARGLRYPEPIVDPASAARAARAAIRARQTSPRAPRPVLVEPLPMRAQGRQMALDLRAPG
ncbi:MAG: deoxyribodipyrimidine photo-lyase [Rhodobacter sp.]|nr:deoxyribodipyrimidine photo-lyase [Paracoccaceae bacterium]MCC0080364.1 deoxyribodipyrimidine photo-lyase [Rhodobacter sp.]